MGWMKVQNLLSPLVILILIGLLAFSFFSRGEITSEVMIRETQIAELEATLVNVFDDQRQINGTATAEIAQLQEASDQFALTLTAVAEEGASAGDGGVDLSGTPDPFASIDDDAPPQVRIRLRETANIRSAGQPVDIIASAAHPLGIAVLNISVNGETIFADSPQDPRMDIITVRWVPEEAGSYIIEAIGTTVRGRASNPVSLQLEIVEETSSAEDLITATLRQIESGVRELRNLEQIEAVEINMIDRLELQETIQVDLFDGFTREDARNRVHVLSAFDFVAPDYPLYETMVTLYGGGVAGYYDEKDNALFVVNDDEILDTEERLTHAHEYMHALQDMHFGLDFLLSDEISADESLARRALAEGEATLLEFLFESRGYLTGEQNADSNPVFPTPTTDQAPNFLVDELAFPYVRGSAFLATFFDEREFEAINEIWADPPRSTEHIIHPERYESGDMPQKVDLPTLDLGDEWRLVEEDVFGEFYFVQYLSLGIEDEDLVNEASEGWGGDLYQVYINEENGEKVMLLSTRWDSEADAAQFQAAYEDWLDAFDLNQIDPNQLAESIDMSIPGAELSCYERLTRLQCLLERDGSVDIFRVEKVTVINLIVNALLR